MVALISYSSFALPEALLFATKPNPVQPALESHFKVLIASFIPLRAFGVWRLAFGVRRSAYRRVGETVRQRGTGNGRAKNSARPRLGFSARLFRARYIQCTPRRPLRRFAHSPIRSYAGRKRDWNRPPMSRIDNSAPKASERFFAETALRTGPSIKTFPPFKTSAREKHGKISST